MEFTSIFDIATPLVMVDMETFNCEMASRKYFTSASTWHRFWRKRSVMMILISSKLKLGFRSSDLLSDQCWPSPLSHIGRWCPAAAASSSRCRKSPSLPGSWSSPGTRILNIGLDHTGWQSESEKSSVFYFFWRSIPNDDWLELDLKSLHPLLVLVVQSCSQVSAILKVGT